jgi:hypothetical protein
MLRQLGQRGLHFYRGRQLRVPAGLARGLHLEMPLDASVDLCVGFSEYELADYVREFCQPGYRAFDVGGQIGLYALAIARLTAAPVICFEFDQEAVARIERNLRSNPPYGQLVSICPKWVGWETNEESGSIALDDAVAQTFAPDVVKVDVEGAELEVLAGARGLLASRRPHLIVEVHSRELERRCGDFLLELGYAPRVVEQRRWHRRGGNAENRWLVGRGRAR